MTVSLRMRILQMFVAAVVIGIAIVQAQSEQFATFSVSPADSNVSTASQSALPNQQEGGTGD